MPHEFPTTKLEPQKDAPTLAEDEREDIFNPEKSEIIPDLSEFFSILEKLDCRGERLNGDDFFELHQEYLENGKDAFVKKLLTDTCFKEDSLKRIIVGDIEKNNQLTLYTEASGCISNLKACIEFVFSLTKEKKEPTLVKPGGSLCEIGGPSGSDSGGSYTLDDILHSGADKYANINPRTEQLDSAREMEYNSFNGNPGKNYRDSFIKISEKVTEECGKFDFVTAYNVFCDTAQCGIRYGIHTENHEESLLMLKKVASIMKVNGLFIMANHHDNDLPFTAKELEEAGFRFARIKESTERKSEQYLRNPRFIDFSPREYVFQYIGKKEKSAE